MWNPHQQLNTTTTAIYRAIGHVDIRIVDVNILSFDAATSLLIWQLTAAWLRPAACRLCQEAAGTPPHKVPSHSEVCLRGILCVLRLLEALVWFT